MITQPLTQAPTQRMVQRWCKAMDITFRPAMRNNLLTDVQWVALGLVLPDEPDSPHEPNNRFFVEACLLLMGHGVLWEAWPAELGSGRKAYQRAMMWAFIGVWADMAKLLPATTVAGELVRKLVADYNKEKITYLPFITEAQWATITPLLPADPEAPQLSNRQFIEEVHELWLSGGLWNAWPLELGGHNKAKERASEWAKQGVWDTISAQLPSGSEISLMFLVIGHESIHGPTL